MLALPHVSGTECIAALEHFGYRAGNRRRGLASLHRDSRVVLVPESATLSPSLVGAILRTADVDPLDFLLALDLAPHGLAHARSEDRGAKTRPRLR